MRLLVCGGRHYNDHMRMWAHLDAIRAEHPDLTVGCGYNPKDSRNQGADQLAYEWAKRRGIPGKCFPAHWDDLEAPGARVVTPPYRGARPYNAAAGPQRNQRMFDLFKPTAAIAFPEDPTGPGTANMIAICRRGGIEPQIVRDKAESDDTRCTMDIPYYGRCHHPAEVDSMCIVHGVKCDGCGAPASSLCSGWVGSFVCCFPLCGNCEGDHDKAAWPMRPAHRPKVARICQGA